MLRQLGYLNTSYIDDSYLQGDTVQECQDNVSKTDHLLTQAGFVTHPDKSVYEPTQKLTFLGFDLDSIKMRVTLTPERTANLKQLCLHALKHPKLAQLIGVLVSSFPGVQYGPLHYRSLEILKMEALSLNKGNFDAMLTINSAGMEDLQWWVDNIEHAFKPVALPKVDLSMHIDASKMGWGAVINGTTTGGRWTSLESQEHINILELRAMFMGLKSFHSIIQSKHVQVYMDNSTAVAYINSMGGTKSTHANELAKEIWHWCIDNSVHISAAHIPGANNVEADKESRVFNDNTEWMLRSDIFKTIVGKLGSPHIDLFASRLNR